MIKSKISFFIVYDYPPLKERHPPSGPQRIIINKKIDYDLYPDLLEQLGIDKSLGDKKLYIRYGGPVETSRGFVLHSDEVIQKETLSIEKGVALTSNSEFFENLSKGKGPENSILALGYAGWGPGQIEKEILANSWMTLAADSKFLFDDDSSQTKTLYFGYDFFTNRDTIKFWENL